MSFVTLTDHAKERSSKRFGLNESKLKEFAEKSVLQGYSINDAPNAQIKNFLKRKKRSNQMIYVYSGYVFIFSDKFKVITTFRMPKKHLMSLARTNTYKKTYNQIKSV